jgi:hypothetical protein
MANTPLGCCCLRGAFQGCLPARLGKLEPGRRRLYGRAAQCGLAFVAGHGLRSARIHTVGKRFVSSISGPLPVTWSGPSGCLFGFSVRIFRPLPLRLASRFGASSFPSGPRRGWNGAKGLARWPPTPQPAQPPLQRRAYAAELPFPDVGPPTDISPWTLACSCESAKVKLNLSFGNLPVNVSVSFSASTPRPGAEKCGFNKKQS